MDTLACAAGSTQIADGGAERRFRDLVHELDGIVWELEPTTQRFTFVSRRAEDLLGYPLERWLASQDFWSTLIDARDRDQAQRAYEEAARGHVVDHEFRATKADGTVIWLRGRVHRAGAGRLRGLMMDATEQKRLEHERDQRLRREQMARAEFEAAVEMVQRLESITEAVLTHRSLDDLLHRILERLHDAVEADTTVILLPTEDGAHLALAHAVGLEAAAGFQARVPIGEGLSGRIAAGGQPIILEDAAAEVDLGPLRAARVHSLIGVPVSVDGDLVGVVHAARRQRRGFSAEEARFLQLAADRVGAAIRNARLFEDAQRARRATEAARQRSVLLADATTALFAGRDAASALAAVARLAVPAVADWCAIDLRDRDGGYRRVALAHRDAVAERAAAVLLGGLTAAPPPGSALGRALSTQVVQWRYTGATPEEMESRGGAEERVLLGQLGVGGYVCAPLIARRRALGALTLARVSEESPLSDDDVALACELARRAAVAVDDRRRRRETRELLRLFARLVSGGLELERAPVALVDVVEQAARAVGEEARAKNVAIDLGGHALDARVSGDGRRLRQVLQRVLEGALRVTPTGGRVRLRLERDGAAAVLDVNAAGASNAPVTGVRLAIVRRLLELHGGSVASARRDDRPTVRIQLPLLA
jgi:PAS domain S-box-containing protein